MGKVYIVDFKVGAIVKAVDGMSEEDVIQEAIQVIKEEGPLDFEPADVLNVFPLDEDAIEWVEQGEDED